MCFSSRLIKGIGNFSYTLSMSAIKTNLAKNHTNILEFSKRFETPIIKKYKSKMGKTTTDNWKGYYKVEIFVKFEVHLVVLHLFHLSGITLQESTLALNPSHT